MNIRMSSKGKRPLRSLTPSDKIHAIQRIHDGESKASVARDIGVPESTLRGWCKNEEKLRFMSRQSAVDKISAESLSDKSDIGAGPPDKRRKIESSSLPLNFSNKTNYEDLSYKHPAINGLDYSTNKALSDLTYNGIASDYAAFSSAVKNKVFGTEMSPPADPSMAAISPLSSLSHLSGLSGLTQSPLAISFNELTSNLNILAQLNPSLAAMTGLNSLNATTNTLRPSKSMKNIPQSTQLQSPTNELSDRQQGLSVKNWAKQKNMPTNEATYVLNLTQNETKNKIKCPSPSLAPSLGGSFTPLSGIPEDPLLYWLKSQQAMLGLNNLYTHPAPTFSSTSPPIRTSTPQQSVPESSPPIASTPLTPSSTPSGSLDDKNAAWFNWCKAFGASLNSLNPTAGAHTNSTPSSTSTETTSNEIKNQKASFENILYSQLTKDTTSPSPRSSSVDSQGNELMDKTDCPGKPEDLSAKVNSNERNSKHSPLPTPAHSPLPTPLDSPIDRESKSPTNLEGNTESNRQSSNSLADCKDVLDSLLYKINNNNPASIGGTVTPNSIDGGNESEESYNGVNNSNNNDLSASNNNNNNNNSNKTDEEERGKCGAHMDKSVQEALNHGEKFLNWLENCSNPRITTVQLMQLRFLISAIKSGNDDNCTQAKDFNINGNINDNDNTNYLDFDDTSIEESHRRN